MKEHNFVVGQMVEVEPNQNDLFEEFTGRITEINNEYIIVTDADDDAWDCEPEQLSLYTGENSILTQKKNKYYFNVKVNIEGENLTREEAHQKLTSYFLFKNLSQVSISENTIKFETPSPV